MESNLFIELAEEQQEVVAGGNTSLEVFDFASYYKNSGFIAQGASAGPKGASTSGIAIADYISTSASKTTYLNRPYYYYPYPID